MPWRTALDEADVSENAVDWMNCINGYFWDAVNKDGAFSVTMEISTNQVD